MLSRLRGHPGSDSRGRLRAALDDALRRRDRVAVSALRSSLSATGDAEAISPLPTVPGAGSSQSVEGQPRLHRIAKKVGKNSLVVSVKAHGNRE